MMNQVYTRLAPIDAFSGFDFLCLVSPFFMLLAVSLCHLYGL